MASDLATLIGNGVVLKTPTADGTAGQFIETDGSGTLSFGAASGGLTVGDAIASGAATRVLFEDGSNNLGQSAGFAYSAGLSLTAAAATDTQVTLNAHASQDTYAEPMLALKTSGGTTIAVLSQYSPNKGGLSFANVTYYERDRFWTSVAGYLISDTTGNDIRFRLWDAGRSTYKWALDTDSGSVLDILGPTKIDISAYSASEIPLAVKLAATPTANALEINTSAGSAGDLFAIAADGLVKFADQADGSLGDPTTDAPADWLTINHAGTERMIPLYTKA